LSVHSYEMTRLALVIGLVLTLVPIVASWTLSLTSPASPSTTETPFTVSASSDLSQLDFSLSDVTVENGEACCLVSNQDGTLDFVVVPSSWGRVRVTVSAVSGSSSREEATLDVMMVRFSFASDTWTIYRNVAWSQRSAPRVACLPSRNTRLLLGGLQNSGGLYTNTVYMSTVPGQWSVATWTPGWPGRAWHATAVLDGKVWVMAGRTADSPDPIDVNDEWYATESVAVSGGAWTLGTSTPGW
jgi:hypothetical protein